MTVVHVVDNGAWSATYSISFGERTWQNFLSFTVRTHVCLLQLQGIGGAVVLMTVAGSHFSHSIELLWKQLGT